MGRDDIVDDAFSSPCVGSMSLGVPGIFSAAHVGFRRSVFKSACKGYAQGFVPKSGIDSGKVGPPRLQGAVIAAA